MILYDFDIVMTDIDKPYSAKEFESRVAKAMNNYKNPIIKIMEIPYGSSYSAVSALIIAEKKDE